MTIQFLLSSVWTANAQFLNETKPPEIKKVCETRVGEAAKGGVLADFNPAPYRWTATGASSSSGAGAATVPSSAAPQGPTLTDFIGVWSGDRDGCRSYKRQQEGSWFVIGEKTFTCVAGAKCRRITYSLKGDTLTVSGQCTEEESGYAPFKEAYKLVAGKLKGPHGFEYAKCPK